jgi:S-adenosylmethionine:tRNA ribosyltransferase-isomerase
MGKTIERSCPSFILGQQYSFMKVADFNFVLPQELIAQKPLKERCSSRLLILHRDGVVEHKRFSDLSEYLNSGDILLINNTKVFPARLTGDKRNGGSLDILLVQEKEEDVWEVLSKGKYTGTLTISEELRAELYEGKRAKFQYSGNFIDLIRRCGSMPLPPYVRRVPDESDKERYQTVYAEEEGSIAAPTAGLHFTEKLLNEITSKNVLVRELTLHIGIGTFKPIRTEQLEKHTMEPEYFEMEKGLIREIENAKVSGNKVVSVGTTTTRAIEGYMSGKYRTNPPNPPLLKGGKGGLRNSKFISGATNIFIYPGYSFKAVTSLVTNFHLPRSTPLMLASAICGWEKLKRSYEEAVAMEYRFFSYGDAMLIL